MNRIFISVVAIALLALGGRVQANVFNLGAGLTNLETVYVGDAGNASNTLKVAYDTNKYGSVAYNYKIGKYEVTAGQYTDFLNNKAKTDPYGLYETRMGSTAAYSYGCYIQRSGGGTLNNPYSYSVALDWANRPVNWVSYWDSLRFANWLGNGQGNGDTETGAYTLNGYTGTDGRTIQRNAGWTWAVTSEDEWYKAAYYKGGSTNAGYWLYPTSTDARPGRDLADVSGNNSNSNNDNNNGYLIGSPYYRTEVGLFKNSDSPYGTFDQGGNILEWTEAIRRIDTGGSTTHAERAQRGGNWRENSAYEQASYRYGGSPRDENWYIGFRVVQAYVPQAVPEPATLLGFGIPMLMIGLGKLRGLRK